MADDRTAVSVTTQTAGAGTYVRTTVPSSDQMENAAYFRDDAATDSWAATTAYKHGDKVKKVSTNGFIYRCKVPGTSGGSEPTWPTTIGLTVVDGTVTWICYVKEAVAWAATTAKVVGDRVKKVASNGHAYVCTVAGTTGGSEPAWTVDSKAVFTDGGVTWREDGPERGY